MPHPDGLREPAAGVSGKGKAYGQKCADRLLTLVEDSKKATTETLKRDRPAKMGETIRPLACARPMRLVISSAMRVRKEEFSSPRGHMENTKGKSWFERLFRPKSQTPPPPQDEAVSLFKLLRTFDAESDDGKRRIQGTIRSLNSVDTLRQIALDRSLRISLRELAIRRGQIGGDEWATFLTKHFVIGKNYGELAAKATPGGDAESGEALTLLAASAFALIELGYEIEGIEVLSPTKLSMTRGLTISVVKKAGQKQAPIAKSNQQESQPDKDKDLVEQAKTLEQLINTTGACDRGYFISRGMPTNVGQLLLELFTICSQRESPVGVDMCKRLLKQHPKSGLAHYLLFNALTAGKPGTNPLNPLAAGESSSLPIETNEEATAAFSEAVRLGCRYIDFNVRAGMMELRTLDCRFD